MRIIRLVADYRPVCLEKEIMQSTVSGERKQERQKMRQIYDKARWAKMSFEKLLRETEDRWTWRRLVNEATNPRIQNG